MDVRVQAFGVCEIGRQFSLRCDPADGLVVHFVLDGEGMFECRYGQFPLTKGSAIVVPPRLPKRLSGAGPLEHLRDADPLCTAEQGLARFHATNGSADLVLGCAELSSRIGEDLPLFEQIERPIIEQSRDPLLSALFATMFDELRAPRLGTRAFVSALMKQVLIVLLRSQPDNETSTLLMTNARLAAAVAAVIDRPGDEHSVGRLAAIAGMSRARFIHHFTVAYDLSPIAFVRAARLSAAARMLRSSELPVKAVAAKAGYRSRSHFSRAFEAKFGLSPSDYRQREHPALAAS